MPPCSFVIPALAKWPALRSGVRQSEPKYPDRPRNPQRWTGLSQVTARKPLQTTSF